MAEVQQSLRSIFDEASEMEPGEQRQAYLDQACGRDTALRANVEELLQSQEAAGGFLADPPRDASGAGVPLAEKPGDRIGRYKLLEKIGEGGMGVVYVAEQEEPVRRRVALKIIKLGMDTRQVVARFEAERQALALMDHPNIAKVFDAGATETGRPYFVMELVQGVPITEFCDKNHLSAEERIKLFIPVCQAIQSAHQKGVIHRDIKPTNVMVTLNGRVYIPVLIDFGLAKATDQKLTEKTFFTNYATMIGTPAYMSPEQAEMSGLDIDTRSDIYGLGVLLYELLTGTTPFPEKRLRAASYQEMQRIILEEEPLRPSTHLNQTLAAADVRRLKSPSADTPGTEEEVRAALRRLLRIKETIALLKGDLDWIVMKCLEKDRTRRYETASGLAADLTRHLENEPVVARPPSTAYRFQKAIRRNRLVFTAAAAVAAALVAGTGVSLWEALEARKAQNFAETQQRRADAQARKASENGLKSRRLLYDSDMNLAQKALKQNNLGLARRLLQRHLPQPGKEDLRGWEWRYLWQLTRGSSRFTLTHRTTPGFSASFSPDGSRLAVGWLDGRVELWDVPGRQLVRTLTEGGRQPWGRVAFSPVRNLLAATSGTNVVSIYDLESGNESILWRAPDQGSWTLCGLAFSQDGSRLVICAGAGAGHGEEDAVWVVNVSSSRIESRHPALWTSYNFFGDAQLSPDNRRLYVIRSQLSPENRRWYLSHTAWMKADYTIQCLDLATGRELWQTEPPPDVKRTALAVSPDGRVLAWASQILDPAIRVYAAATGRFLKQLEGHTAWVSKLAFTKDGRSLISSAADQTIRVWDTSTWTEANTLRGDQDEVWAVAVSERARLIASASRNGDLLVWNREDNGADDGYTRLPPSLGFDEIRLAGNSRLLILQRDKSPELIDLKTGAFLGLLPEIKSYINVTAWGDLDTSLFRWDGTNQIVVEELRGTDFIQTGVVRLNTPARPTGLAFHHQPRLVAWSEASAANSIYLAKLATPSQRQELKADVSGLVPFRVSAWGDCLMAMTPVGKSLRVWNVNTYKMVASVEGDIVNARFAAGGRVMVAAFSKQNNKNEIGFYDLANPERAPKRFQENSLIMTIAVSPDGELVAESTNYGLIRLFNPATGELIETLHAHMNSVGGLAFSPDGRRLVSTFGGREAVKIWDVGTWQELLTLENSDNNLGHAVWSADGNVILAGTPCQIWRAPSWEEIAAAETKGAPSPANSGREQAELQRP